MSTRKPPRLFGLKETSRAAHGRGNPVEKGEIALDEDLANERKQEIQGTAAPYPQKPPPPPLAGRSRLCYIRKAAPARKQRAERFTRAAKEFS
jgi:hypothetical protein